MPEEYAQAKEILEKIRAVENIIQFTLNGAIVWENTGTKYVATYENKLRNEIEFETFSATNHSFTNMSKIIIKNENGKIIIYNKDITKDLLTRFINVIQNHVKDTNILQDFLY